MAERNIIAVCGKAGAGKDTFYEEVLLPRGFIRLQMTLHYKIWLVSTGRATWEEVFVTKPPRVRKILQEEITQPRYDYDEEIWVRVVQNWMKALEEIVGVDTSKVAITDMRFLTEIRAFKAIGAKVLHIEAKDQLENVAPELRTHRSETELDSPEMKMLRDSYLFNQKKGRFDLRLRGQMILGDWGWLPKNNSLVGDLRRMHDAGQLFD